jgi:hypothetical protein
MSHIWVPKKKIIEVHLPTMCSYMDGDFVLEAYQCREMADGRSIEIPGTRKSYPRSDNIILDQALDWYGSQTPNGQGQMYRCHVGTGSSTEQATDTALFEWVAAVNKDDAYNSWWAQGSPPYYGAKRWKYRFSPNFGGGNINIQEIGVGAGNTMALQYLSARALTKDGGGTPTPVPVLATEYLDAYYTRRNYPGHITEGTGVPVDLTGTIDIAGTSYGYTMRPALVTQSAWGNQIDLALGDNNNFTPGGGFGGGAVCYGPSATLGTVTQSLSAAESAGNSYTGNTRLGTYIPFSHQREIIYWFDLDQGNISSGGFNGILVTSTMGAYQILLDAQVPKDNTKLFEFYHNWSWARHA